ncbi:hypothetical protein EPA93_00190 [Ktedonosporobacter rubrisoli]|uniref:FxLD family lantipeptide n=1 Tax=Ktedonosporobacter rubrisoli TaxID=2509675 RepID=A0A4P6JIM4_KTERU|nr:hypothetical protein [Ktedonosporobacter rubrisoli]QBD74496.1 hypothetical protein EPA93_00190 [Ktedonosporobacter rubrisoli]
MPHTTILDMPVIDEPACADEFELDVRISLTTHVPQIVASGSDCSICTSCYNSCDGSCHSDCNTCWTTAVCA